MLRAQLRRQARAGTKSTAEARMQGLVVFSVAGKRLAARTDEIGAVNTWPRSMVVPSDTPFVASLVRQAKRCLPVFDLAAKFNRTIPEGRAVVFDYQTYRWPARHLYRFAGAITSM